MTRRYILTALWCAAGTLPAAATSGCAHTAEKMAEAATPTVVEETIETATGPGVAEEIGEILAIPEYRKVASSLGAGSVDGAMASLRQQSPERLQVLRERYVGETVEMTLEQVTSDRMQSRSREMSRAIARGAARGFAEGMEQDLGPAMRTVIAQDLKDGLLVLLRSEAFSEAMAETAREMSRQSVIGAQAGAAADGLAGWLTTGLLGALLLLLALALGLLYRRWRGAREEARRQEEAARTLVRALGAVEGQTGSTELREELRHELDRSLQGPGGDYVRELLAQEFLVGLGSRRQPRS